MPILVFAFLPLSVHLRLRRLFVGLDELLFGRDFLHVEVLVFFVSSRDAEVLGDQCVVFLFSAVRKPKGSSTPSVLLRMTGFERLGVRKPSSVGFV